MKKKIQALLKNERGFTLVELLAVIVILGIIAAIAIPSIANIIDNSKKDAHIANAEQMIGAARLAIAANDKALWANNATQSQNTNAGKITLEELISAGYIEDKLQDPDTKGYYNRSNSFVMVTTTAATAISGSKTTVSTVTLLGQERGIGGAEVGTLDRTDVAAANQTANQQ